MPVITAVAGAGFSGSAHRLAPARRSAWLGVIAIILLWWIVFPIRAESLSTLRTGHLPTLPIERGLLGLAAVDGGVVALTDDTAWVLTDDQHAWRRVPLPSSDAGGSVLEVSSDGQQAYLLLGAAGGQAIDRIARLRLERGRLTTQALPTLPMALAAARLTTLGSLVYVTGVAVDGRPRLLSLDASQQDASGWTALPPWPGGGAVSSLVGQSSAIYVTVAAAAQTSAANLSANPASADTPSTNTPSASNESPDTLITSASAPAAERLLRWTRPQGWREQAPVPGYVAADFGRAIGQAHVLYLLGSSAGDAAPRLMSLHTITGSWAALPDAGAAGVLHAVPWKNGLLWARPATDGGGTGFGFAELQPSKHLLRWLDWLVIAVYMALMIGIGLYFYLREKRTSTADFFVGGRSIPFWAAGISLYATNTSSISFIAIPAKAFESNWQYLTNNLVAVLGLMFVAVKIVPLLRRLDLMSVFSYLETRFHPSIRMLASALFIVMQIGSRMSVILFLPALAIATITGIDVVWSIWMMGVFTIVYTTLGGMKAVIWTDFVQVFVMFGGALFAIGFIVYQIQGGIPEFVSVAMAEDKMRIFDFSFDLTQATVWGFIFLVVFDVVLTFPKDQVLMQRVLSTKSDKEAGRSIWTLAAIMIPGGFVFYMIGTALYVYYKAHPDRMNPLLPIDATFPLFIAAELPMGVTGLIIAGILAAAMSTLSSIINSVSTLASVDFYDKLVKNPTPKQSVLFAEVTGVAVGLVGIGVALLLSRYDIRSLFDVSIALVGLLGGGFAGAYTLGMFTRRANSPGVAIGIASSIVLTLVAWTFDLVHPYYYLAISILLCIVIGYVASLFFPRPSRSLDGLTIYVKSDTNYVRPCAG